MGAIKHPRHSAGRPRQAADLPYQQRHRRIAAEPEWRPQNRYASADLPPGCRAWLLDDGSLTGRLIDLGRGPLRVERLYQGWQVPLASERRLLALPQPD